VTKKLTFEDLQPHVDMLCDALENKGASPSGVSYNPEVYTYAEKYRKLLEQVRTKSIGYTDMWIQLRQMERDTIGSFSDDKTADYDDQVAVLRTIIVFVNFITCLFIMANIVHNW
jgi:hypothetical protein